MGEQSAAGHDDFVFVCLCLQVVVRLSDELLSQAVMVVENCRPTLTINLSGARQHWLEGMLRHEIGEQILIQKLCSTLLLVLAIILQRYANKEIIYSLVLIILGTTYSL